MMLQAFGKSLIRYFPIEKSLGLIETLGQVKYVGELYPQQLLNVYR